MNETLDVDSDVWRKKAMAFVTRSHRHLWGKNNEDPMAFLFSRGLSHAFLKASLVGWNKFGQHRPLKNWGRHRSDDAHGTFFLPSGIVFPYIMKKELISVFISGFADDQTNRTLMVPGSGSPTLCLVPPAQDLSSAVLIRDLFDGLFLFQETGLKTAVIIHPDPRIPLDRTCHPRLRQAATLFLCRRSGTDPDGLDRLLSGIPLPVRPAMKTLHYPTKEALVKQVSDG